MPRIFPFPLPQLTASFELPRGESGRSRFPLHYRGLMLAVPAGLAAWNASVIPFRPTQAWSCSRASRSRSEPDCRQLATALPDDNKIKRHHRGSASRPRCHKRSDRAIHASCNRRHGVARRLRQHCQPHGGVAGDVHHEALAARVEPEMWFLAVRPQTGKPGPRLSCVPPLTRSV